MVRPKSQSQYLNKKTGEPTILQIPRVGLYVLEAIRNLDTVLADIKRAGGMIAGYKSVFVAEGIKVVAYVCDFNGRYPDIEKVKKILHWPPCMSVTEANTFIGLCVYYCIWIWDFMHIANPIFETFRKQKAKKK